MPDDRPELAAMAPVSAQIDMQLVRSAIAKRQHGDLPTAPERAALRSWEKQREAEQRWRHYRSVPKRDYLELSGRTTKVLHGLADRYSLPLRGRTIDLAAAVNALHAIIARNVDVIDRPDGGSQNGQSEALELFRRERAATAKIDRLEKERSLVPITEVRESVSMLASILRGANEKLMREYGPGAGEIMNEALDEYELAAAKRFGGDDA